MDGWVEISMADIYVQLKRQIAAQSVVTNMAAI